MDYCKEALLRLRAGGLYELARPKQIVQYATTVEEESLEAGIYKVEGKVFGLDERCGYGFVRHDGTLIVPYHLTQGRPIEIEGRVYSASVTNIGSDYALYNGYTISCSSPVVNSVYVVKNPTLCQQISLKCVDVSDNGVCSFVRIGEEAAEPLQGWSGLPIMSLSGELYGFYTFHVWDNQRWETRCFEGIMNTVSNDWEKVVDVALMRGFAQVYAGTGAGKTVGISKALLKKGVKNVVILQPTRVMVENLFKVIGSLGYSVGYKHGEGQKNPGSNVMIYTYGTFLAKIMHRQSKPHLIFCDEVHDCKAEIQAVLEYLGKNKSSKLIYATATPDGNVKKHAGRFDITVDTYVEDLTGVELGNGVHISQNYLLQASKRGLLIFVPTIASANAAYTALIRAFPALRSNICLCTSKEMAIVMQSGILTDDKPKILVATNTLESGVTVNVGSVIDFGKTCFPSIHDDSIEWVVRDSTEYESAQRMGRVGRIKAGNYMRINGDNYSPYDKYERTYVNLAIYLRALNLPIPTEVMSRFDGQVYLYDLVFGSSAKRIQKAVDLKFEPLMVLQYVDDDGKIWAKFAQAAKITTMRATPTISYNGWLSDNSGIIVEPRFKLGHFYVDAKGTKVDCRSTSGAYLLAGGLLLSSYVLSKLFKRSFTSFSAYKVCDWDEYVQSNYANVRHGYSLGKPVVYLATTGSVQCGGNFVLRKLVEGLSQNCASERSYWLAYEDLLSVLPDPRNSISTSQYAVECVRQHGVAESLSRAILANQAEEFMEDVLKKAASMAEKESTVLTPKVIAKEVGTTKESVMTVLAEARDLIQSRLGWLERIKNFTPKVIYDWLKVRAETVKIDWGNLASSSKEYVGGYLANNPAIVSFARGLTVPSGLTIRNTVFCVAKGYLFGVFGMNVDYSMYCVGNVLRGMFSGSDRGFMGCFINGFFEIAGSVLTNLSIPVVEHVVITTELDVSIMTAALFSSAAIAGMSAFCHSGVGKMAVRTTSDTRMIAMSVSAMGFLTGALLGYVAMRIEDSRERKIEQVAHLKNSSYVLEWMQESGRMLYGMSRCAFTVVCVGSCYLLSPKLTAGFTVVGLALSGFSFACLDRVVECVPTILMASQAVSTRSIVSMAWLLFGPIVSYLFSPEIFPYAQFASNAAAFVRMTSGASEQPVIAQSGTYSVVASLDERFGLNGDLLILGEGAGGASQYFNAKPAISTITSVCMQRHTIPTITPIHSSKMVLYEDDIRNFKPEREYDSLFIDISGSDSSASLREKLKEIVFITKPKRIISSGYHRFEEYGVARHMEVNNLYYVCLVRNHRATSSKVEKVVMNDRVEVYVPTRNYTIPEEMPDLSDYRVNYGAANLFEGPALYSIGTININRGFERANVLKVNSTLSKTPIYSLIGGYPKVMTQASRREDDFMSAIHQRVNVRMGRVRLSLLQMFGDAMDLCLTDKVYRPYTLEENLSKVVRTGSGGLTDRCETMGQFVDRRLYTDLGYDKTKVIWSMVPKYENRNATKGIFPPPRIVTMSNLDFRFFCNQVLGPMNEESPLPESSGKIVYPKMMQRLIEEKEKIEREQGEPYFFYAGDISLWDACVQEAHIDKLSEALSKRHTKPELVRDIFRQQKRKFCVTANGLLIWKVGGVDSGSVTTKLGNDCMNAARDLTCISVSVGQPLEVVKTKVRRIFCGDDFVGVAPVSWKSSIEKHYANVSKDLGFPLKNIVETSMAYQDLSFCSHYWITATSSKGKHVLPYRSRQEILERLLLQPVNSIEMDSNRAAQKCLAYLILYGGDRYLRRFLEQTLDKIPTFSVQLKDPDKYGFVIDRELNQANWKVVIRRVCVDILGVEYEDLKYSPRQMAMINGIDRSVEAKLQDKIRDFYV